MGMHSVEQSGMEQIIATFTYTLTAGVRKQADPFNCRFVMVIADTGNSGNVFMGNSSIDTAAAPIRAGGSSGIAIDNSAKIWLATDTTGTIAHVVITNGPNATSYTAGSSPGSPQSMNVSEWGGTATSLGQKAMASSVPVAIASDQSAISVGTESAAVNVGQTTSNTSAVQLSASSVSSTNGILVQALSTNTASVFIGGSGVTTTTGFELSAGQAAPFTASDINLLYVIGSNSADKVCWSVL